MNHELRIWGDPFRDDDAAARLRRLLAAATAAGWRCGLCLTGATGEPGNSARRIELSDGARGKPVFTSLSDAELADVLGAAGEAVFATAPLVVFGGDDQVVLAGLEYPEACAVIAAGDRAEAEVLDEATRALAKAPRRDPAVSAAAAELAPYLALPPPPAGGPLVVWSPERDAELERSLTALTAVPLCFVSGPLEPDALASASAVLMPVRLAPEDSITLAALASGRPLAISRFAATAAVVGRPGLCVPIGGRVRGERFEPDPQSVQAALAALSEGEGLGAQAARARRHVLEHHRRGAPAPAPAAARGARPVVVLEAPLFERSSSSVLTLETARALLRRGRVDVRLVPVVPLQRDLGWLRRQAPDVLPALCRRPPRADLWLSAGWPPRPDRPDTATHAVRLDWEYGALPAEHAPGVTDEADQVVVHSEAVARMVAAAGRPRSAITAIPHGVDGQVFHENAEPCAQVLAFKRDRPALLFVGGLIWRKGVDLLLSAVIQRPSCCLVIKSIGAATCYAGYHLGELLERVRRHPDAPDVLLIEEDLTAAEMAGVYRASDLLVHPYRGEGFGMPVLEARACGLPVLVTRGGSTDDFCDSPGALGISAVRRHLDLPGAHLGRPWVLEPDPASLAAGLDEAFGDLTALRVAARAEAPAVRARFDWAKAAQRLERMAFENRCSEGDRKAGTAGRPIPRSVPTKRPSKITITP